MESTQLNNAFVWSVEIQDWEPTLLTDDEISLLAFCHSKTMSGKIRNIYIDNSGRYFYIEGIDNMISFFIKECK